MNCGATIPTATLRESQSRNGQATPSGLTSGTHGLPAWKNWQNALRLGVCRKKHAVENGKQCALGVPDEPHEYPRRSPVLQPPRQATRRKSNDSKFAYQLS